jgi:Family of unknown function (DUF5677)
VFHDELMKDEEECKRWHQVYGRLSEAVDVSLGKFLEVIKEVERCAHATGKDIHAVLQMLMYEFADSIDGASALVRVGASRNCAQPLRTGLEIGLGLRYILEDKDNYEPRSLSYEYFHLLDGLKWAQKCDPDHPVGQQLRKELEGDEHADIFDVLDSGINVKAEIEKQEKKVNSPRYSTVRAEIDRMKDEKKKAGNWYSLWDGPKDLRMLAWRLKLLSTYEVLYRTWSNTAHGEGAMKRIGGRVGDGTIQFVPLRSPSALPEKCRHACYLANGLTLTVVDKLVPQLREGLKDWYIGHMKPAFDYIDSVEIGE